MKSRAFHTGPGGTKYEITTNNHWRWPVSWSELTKKERARFDYLRTEKQRTNADFIRAYGTVFHTQELVRTDVPGWDGIYSETMFSAVLFQVNAAGEWRTGRLTC